MKTIDCLGEICPLPAMRLKQARLRAKPGDSILLITDHSCVPVSIGEYCRLQRLLCEIDEVMNGVWEITVTVPAVN